ncbi:MAG: hypothetical protein IPO61_05975 [Gammaproteobacteria bacterium]|nr:hypothetical protein [Gammaproteobacteria bacterium]
MKINLSAHKCSKPRDIHPFSSDIADRKVGTSEHKRNFPIMANFTKRKTVFEIHKIG